ncbi:MAG: hypothetical protein GTO45_39340 [Candidatus Aminicenantes bacterium]|nr:hypothetical protein [Candidatus Aminicenantes bacterium]NIM84684.1 hypothetical protein [Candidatus Aminicenantes bacterium]NIN24183.1 hypothetical protein [Candidatus Aminicenantes bacterium]NIN47908.1 hypothetical protein [Candidatus Aminicenantes bacterium]NIN90846.1 hypothetical protein [Candidatus Aminicenantes bacterium]
MAEEIEAVRVYNPRVEQGKTVEVEDVAALIAGRTSFTGGAVINMLWEFREAITFFALAGRPVRLKGLGVFAPRIDKDGVFSLNYRPDKWLKSELNVAGKFKGKVVNRDMIGKSVEEMIQRWNQEHPDDKIEIKEKN